MLTRRVWSLHAFAFGIDHGYDAAELGALLAGVIGRRRPRLSSADVRVVAQSRFYARSGAALESVARLRIVAVPFAYDSTFLQNAHQLSEVANSPSSQILPFDLSMQPEEQGRAFQSDHPPWTSFSMRLLVIGTH